MFLRDITPPRGPIVTADGVVARPVGADERRVQVPARVSARDRAAVRARRRLPVDPVRNTGVEAEYYDRARRAATSTCTINNLADFFSGKDRTGTVVLTLSTKAQQPRPTALAGQRGSVVVLDVQTGGVVAMYSNPTFDPNPLASHDTKTAQTRTARSSIADPTNPLLARAWREIYPPGSTFKTVTAAIALERRNVDVDTQFPLPSPSIPLPLDRRRHAAELRRRAVRRHARGGFIVSCNTTFGQVGLDLGEQFATGIQRFGVEHRPAADSDLDPDDRAQHRTRARARSSATSRCSRRPRSVRDASR